MFYWQQRQHLKYYKCISEILDNMTGESLLDVGGKDTPMVLNGNFEHRALINLKPVKNQWAGVDYHIVDFMEWHAGPFDVVMCLQVLEHLDNDIVEPFTQKLFETASKAVVISIPYKWRFGFLTGHIQDPVDEEKLFGWTQREPDRSILVEDRLTRLVCIYAM